MSAEAPEAIVEAAAASDDPVKQQRRARTRAKPQPQRPPRLQTLLWQRLVLTAMTRAAARVQRMSRPASLRFGQRLGDLAYRLAARQRQRAAANLRLAFGDEEMDAPAREVLIRDVFRHFATALVDFLRAPALDRNALDRAVSCEGWEYVEAAMRGGRGVIFATAHIGNWEILGRWLSQVKGIRMTAVGRDPKQAAFAAYIRKMREGAGFAVLSKGDSARELLKALRGGETVMLLTDQNSGDLFIPFFGVPAGTVVGPAALTLKTGAPIIPTYFLQNADGSFHVECHPPIPAHATDDYAADVARITEQLNRTLEGVIRRHPAQWLWLHNRWKSAFEEENREIAWQGNEQTYRAALSRMKDEG